MQWTIYIQILDYSSKKRLFMSKSFLSFKHHYGQENGEVSV